MAIYAIGDVQGCYQSLQRLLTEINFVAGEDQLWFVGDLVNRGPESLQVLRFIKSLQPAPVVVLGNHDLHLLALVFSHAKPSVHDTLDDLLAAPDCLSLCEWLRQQKLFHFDERLNTALVHAGLCPQWTVTQAVQYAQEVETLLHSAQAPALLQAMYGNKPEKWQEDLTGWDRYRFIINCFTRLRICDSDGTLQLSFKKTLAEIPDKFFPWYAVPQRKSQASRIVFGHWAALSGQIAQENLQGIDGGCVWGHDLIALNIETWQRHWVHCHERGEHHES